MQCFNKVGTALWWGPSAVREIPDETKTKQTKKQCCGQKGLRNHIRGLLNSLPITKLPFPWWGMILWDQSGKGWSIGL